MGALPVIWIAKEGEEVTEMLAMTESTSTEVFVQLTVRCYAWVSSEQNDRVK